MRRLAYKLLRLLDAERSHNIAKWAMKHRLFAPGIYKQPKSVAVMWGTPINNPFGLAAGFDKNGELVDVIEDYGFGFIEVGSVTYRGGHGNPRPRLFRLENGDLLNRMGLNGEPAEIVANRLAGCKNQRYGVNIAKTHSPDIMGDAAIRDIIDSYKILRKLGIYTVLNISCPNTAEGKTFEHPQALKELLSEVERYRTGARPLLVKLSPGVASREDIEAVVLDSIVKVCEDFNVNGYVVSNTLPYLHPRYGKGGRSGVAVFGAARKVAHLLQHRLHKKMIMGVGGIFSGRDMIDFRDVGVDFCQAYNGFVSGPNAGVDFAHTVNREADELR
jgi:dihydroorotate dehydrogenase